MQLAKNYQEDILIYIRRYNLDKECRKRQDKNKK